MGCASTLGKSLCFVRSCAKSSGREEDRAISVLVLHTLYVRASEQGGSSTKQEEHPD
jgi:hypothetical protein